MKRFLGVATVIGICALALTASAGNLNTSGKCPGNKACELGLDSTTSLSLNTDGADLSVDATSNTLILTATTTGSATFTGADAATPANTIFDTTGAGTVQVGSADVTAATIVTDGGTITFDGSILALLKVSSAASGTLSTNRITLLTATGDYTLPDCEVGDIGTWYTLVVRDASETASILLADATDVINYSGITPAAGDELDSPTAGATTAGSTVTIVCTQADVFSVIHAVGTWVDGGSS